MESAEEHKKKGNEAFKNADWDLAIKEYNKAISLDNKQPAYFSNRAACWSSKGNHESALADASRCLELDPAYVKGYSRKGKALFDLSRLDEAEEAYKAGLAVDATNQGCTQGLADVQAARASQGSSGSSFGSTFSNFSASSAASSASGWLQKLKQAGIGGRLQMYMVAFAGYYMYKNYMGNPKSTETSETASEPDTEVQYPARTSGISLQRGFEKVQGQWSSFLELREASENSLVFLHRTASSADAEFATVLPAVQKMLPSPVNIFAPDRPCHGYSPCEGSSDIKWLQGLLKSRQAQHVAYIASGKEAAQTILGFLRKRQESAPVLLISPGAAADRPSGDFQQWLKRQSGASPRALADAVRWGASVLERATADDGVQTGSTEGCSITILTEASETEDKVFLEELEEQGHVVRSRQLSPEDSLHEEVVKEASQLLV
eukprot:Skav202340  [mRNA]  locus=scaffold2638:17883:19187:- [translate_table: standard]